MKGKIIMEKNWINKKESFEVVDVRKLMSNFLPILLKKAQNIPVGKGLCIIQSFEPIPLYSALADLGFDYITEKKSEREYRVYFYRLEERDVTYETGADMPFKPTAIINYKKIDDLFASQVVNFWKYIWEKENPAIDLKTKLLLSMSNAVGGSRFRQATRELIKAYSLGTTTEELDEIFALFVWNQGIGNFSSEIGPSTLFGAYQQIKNSEKKGMERKKIVDSLLEIFGDQNPEVNTLYEKRKKLCKKC